MSESAVSIVRSWRDGDFPQINALPAVHSKKKWIDEKIGHNKQSANRSGTEQSADLWDCFKSLKRNANSSTMKGQPDNIIIHRTRSCFRENNVALKGMHETCLLSFIGRLPEIMSKDPI